MKVVIAFCLLAVAMAVPVQDPVSVVAHEVFAEPDGSKFRYSFETGDGTKAEENGELGVVRGSYSYVADDGQTYSVSYTADETGYHPEGAHIPVAPPVPEAILKALKYISEHSVEEVKNV